MNKNCDTELAVARIAGVPLQELDYGDGSGYSYGYDGCYGSGTIGAGCSQPHKA